VKIPLDKIGEVIGPRGKIIKELVEETGAQIDVDEEGGRGVVKIYATSAEKANAARDRINAIANPTLPEVGERYQATVVKTVDFGAFVSLTPGTVSSDVSACGKYLLVHALHAPDPAAEIARTKQRYEARLQRIFV
jgi:polyribonucleotide nucleotidyltransferase